MLLRNGKFKSSKGYVRRQHKRKQKEPLNGQRTEFNAEDDEMASEIAMKLEEEISLMKQFSTREELSMIQILHTKCPQKYAHVVKSVLDNDDYTIVFDGDSVGIGFVDFPENKKRKSRPILGYSETYEPIITIDSNGNESVEWWNDAMEEEEEQQARAKKRKLEEQAKKSPPVVQLKQVVRDVCYTSEQFERIVTELELAKFFQSRFFTAKYKQLARWTPPDVVALLVKIEEDGVLDVCDNDTQYKDRYPGELCEKLALFWQEGRVLHNAGGFQALFDNDTLQTPQYGHLQEYELRILREMSKRDVWKEMTYMDLTQILPNRTKRTIQANCEYQGIIPGHTDRLE